jgi:hypothetical protein
VTSSVVTLSVTASLPTFTSFVVNPAGTEATLQFSTSDPFDTTNSFTLQSTTNIAATPNSGFTNVPSVSFTGSNGVFQVEIPTSGPDSFYRLLHN